VRVRSGRCRRIDELDHIQSIRTALRKCSNEIGASLEGYQHCETLAFTLSVAASLTWVQNGAQERSSEP